MSFDELYARAYTVSKLFHPRFVFVFFTLGLVLILSDLFFSYRRLRHGRGPSGIGLVLSLPCFVVGVLCNFGSSVIFGQAHTYLRAVLFKLSDVALVAVVVIGATRQGFLMAAWLYRRGKLHPRWVGTWNLGKPLDGEEQRDRSRDVRAD